jgi:hypothetical protein
MVSVAPDAAQRSWTEGAIGHNVRVVRLFARKVLATDVATQNVNWFRIGACNDFFFTNTRGDNKRASE